MKNLKTYEGFINEGILDIPVQIMKIIRKFKLFDILSKIKKALKEMPSNIDAA